MYKVFNFNVIKVITEIEGILVNETPLHVGKGAGELGEIDLPIERDANGIPYIPGSSIKGSFRALSEAIARASGYKVCDPLNPKNLCSISSKAIKEAIDLTIRGKDLNDVKNTIIDLYKGEKLTQVAKDIKGREFRSVEELISYIMNTYGPCIVCRIFGNTELASHITFFDVYPVSKDLRTLSRTRVAIDRFRSASSAGALFTYEYIPKGYEWNFKIRVINIDPIDDRQGPEAKLLRTIIKYLHLWGIQIGGMKTIGHGILRLDPKKTSIRKYVIENLKVKYTSFNLAEVINSW